MNESVFADDLEAARKSFPWGGLSLFRGVGMFVGVCLFLLFFGGMALGPIAPGNKPAPDSAAMVRARSVGLALFAYANDHDRQYPDGKSSTEVFQKLIDGQYVADETLFFLPMPGKTPPEPGQKLKPENVSFDVTSGLDRNSPDKLPLVFLTGYKVDYSPGGVAVPVMKPYPRFGMETHGFLERLTGWRWLASIQYGSGGMAVCNNALQAAFIHLQAQPNSDSFFVPNFIPPDFKPDGRTYRQLTPEGALP